MPSINYSTFVTHFCANKFKYYLTVWDQQVDQISNPANNRSFSAKYRQTKNVKIKT